MQQRVSEGYGIDSESLLGFGSVTRLSRSRKAHVGIGAQGEFLLDPSILNFQNHR
jgi:hypothetical protein